LSQTVSFGITTTSFNLPNKEHKFESLAMLPVRQTSHSVEKKQGPVINKHDKGIYKLTRWTCKVERKTKTPIPKSRVKSSPLNMRECSAKKQIMD
jgi:hypothetical protein